MAKGLLLLQPALQFFDNSGNPLSGGKLFFYVPSSSTKKDTYTDSTKNTANANPYILDSAGRVSSGIFLDGSYDMKVSASTDTDPPAAVLQTVSNFTTMGQLLATTSTSSSTYTMAETDRDKVILVDASGGAKTVNVLAAATAGDGFVFYVKKIDSSGNNVVIDGNGSETLDGATTSTLSSQYQCRGFICDGTQWWRLFV